MDSGRQRIRMAICDTNRVGIFLPHATERLSHWSTNLWMQTPLDIASDLTDLP
jgi:hypothetical protein